MCACRLRTLVAHFIFSGGMGRIIRRELIRTTYSLVERAPPLFFYPFGQGFIHIRQNRNNRVPQKTQQQTPHQKPPTSTNYKQQNHPGKLQNTKTKKQRITGRALLCQRELNKNFHSMFSHSIEVAADNSSGRLQLCAKWRNASTNFCENNLLSIHCRRQTY